jgi:hypothetical protein
VLIKVPNQNEQTIPDVCVVAGYETSLHQTALRGWVRRGTLPVAGAVITVQNVAGQAISDKRGSWTFAFPFSQGAQAATLNAAVQGLSAQTRTVMLVPRATIVVDPIQF